MYGTLNFFFIAFVLNLQDTIAELEVFLKLEVFRGFSTYFVLCIYFSHCFDSHCYQFVILTNQ